MNIGSQEYAGLANDAYRDLAVGRRPAEQDEIHVIEGAEYRIVEHADNPRTGYQGTIYQRLEGGDVVVAHRGTEEIWKDAVIADGAMVVARTNPQAEDAIALTGRAIAFAHALEAKPGQSTPEVTVTGHSLGGALAQVAAHHYDLRGETFNAYGSASLNRRIPEGPNGRVINHVMANDAVSAASGHYGETTRYATEREITVLHQSGYFNNRVLDAVTPDLALVAAGRSLGSHSMHNFLPVDGEGRPDVSILQDPSARARAADNVRMIDDYRGDVESLRRAVTLGVRGPVGWIQDGVSAVRGPVEAGEPGRGMAPAREGGKGAEGLSSATGPGRPSNHVGQLLDAAQTGSGNAVRAAVQDLQLSEAGQTFQQRAEAASLPMQHGPVPALAPDPGAQQQDAPHTSGR